MDPITLLWTAIVSGATAAATQTLLDQPVRTAYAKLKELITQKLGQTTDLSDTIAQVEAKPASAGRQTMLREELAGAAQAQPILLNDPTLLTAATHLLTLLGQAGHPTVTAGDRGVAIGGAVTNSQITTGDNNRNIQAGTYIERQEGDRRQINTEGGPYVAGNVNTGSDFVGRDKK